MNNNGINNDDRDLLDDDVYSSEAYSANSNDLEYDIDVFQYFDTAYKIDVTSRFTNMMVIILNSCFQIDNEHDMVSLKLIDLVVDQTYGNRLTLRKINPMAGLNNYKYINTVERQSNISKCPIFGIGIYLLYTYHDNPVTFENYASIPLLKLSSNFINPGVFNYNANTHTSLDFTNAINRFKIRTTKGNSEYSNVLFPWLNQLEKDFLQKDRTNYILSLLIELFKYISNTVLQDLLFSDLAVQLKNNVLLHLFPFFFNNTDIHNLKSDIMNKDKNVKNEIQDMKIEIQFLKELMLKQIEMQERLYEMLKQNNLNHARSTGEKNNSMLRNTNNNNKTQTQNNNDDSNNSNSNSLNTSSNVYPNNSVSISQVLGENLGVNTSSGMTNNNSSNVLNGNSMNPNSVNSPMFGNILQGGTPSLMIPPLSKFSPYVPGSPAPRSFKNSLASPNVLINNVADVNSNISPSGANATLAQNFSLGSNSNGLTSTMLGTPSILNTTNSNVNTMGNGSNYQGNRVGVSSLRLQNPNSTSNNGLNNETNGLVTSQQLLRSPSVTNVLSTMTNLVSASGNPPPITSFNPSANIGNNNSNDNDGGNAGDDGDDDGADKVFKPGTNSATTFNKDSRIKGQVKVKKSSSLGIDKPKSVKGIKDKNTLKSNNVKRDIKKKINQHITNGTSENSKLISEGSDPSDDSDSVDMTISSGSTDKKGRKNQDIKYKLCRDNKSINDLYQEWYYGLDNGKKPSIKSLIQAYGWRRWKVMDDSHFFPTRRIIIDYIERETSIGFSNDKFNINLVSREDARKHVANDLEWFRAGNNLSLNSISILLRNMKKNLDFTIYTGGKIDIRDNKQNRESKENENYLIGEDGYLLKKLNDDEKINFCKKNIG